MYNQSGPADSRKVLSGKDAVLSMVKALCLPPLRTSRSR